MYEKLVILTPKDIQRITGYCYKTSVKMHRRIRENVGKRMGQFVTIDDFCAYTGLTREDAKVLDEASSA